VGGKEEFANLADLYVDVIEASKLLLPQALVVMLELLFTYKYFRARLQTYP